MEIEYFGPLAHSPTNPGGAGARSTMWVAITRAIVCCLLGARDRKLQLGSRAKNEKQTAPV